MILCFKCGKETILGQNKDGDFCTKCNAMVGKDLKKLYAELCDNIYSLHQVFMMIDQKEFSKKEVLEYFNEYLLKEE